MNEFLVFACGYAVVIAATANACYIAFKMGVAVGERRMVKPVAKEVLQDDDGIL